MARDEAAARTLPEGCGLLRFYAWKRPTLSFGRNEPARDRFDPQELAAAAIDVVRRPTGGRAVLHDRELTYSVVLPLRGAVGGPGGPREIYTRVNRALAAGLASLHVPAEVAGTGAVARPDAGPCFDMPAPGEVVAHGRKLVGSAQVRIGGALLQHGSILLYDDQGRIDHLARARDVRTSSGPAPITLAELTETPPSRTELAAALEATFRAELGGEWRSAPGNPSEGWGGITPGVEEELRRHHESGAWVWRR